MKKWVVTALLVCLATGSLLSGISVSPALGASTTMKRNSQVTTPVQKPIHDSIVFNDYQVAGLSTGGWNWVKNDEFILPPDTPLEVDLTQTTYGSGTNVNRHEVFLDGTELTAFRGEKQANQSMLKWEVPRFSIPSSKLTAGIHTLTFVVKDGNAQSSAVSVQFRVKAQNSASIYEGEKPTGEPVPSGNNSAIFGLTGSKSYASSVPGTWKLTDKTTNTEMRSVDGTMFSTGPLQQGEYELLFLPGDGSMTPWTGTIRVGLAELYLGKDASGQKLSQNQLITATQAPGTVQLYSPFPGRWWVNGTGQTLTDSQSIEVAIPEMLAGMKINVTFQPNQDQESSYDRISTESTVQIQIPGTPEACGPTSATATMDVLMQNNEKSSLLVERQDLYSSDVTVRLYQNPIHLIWLTTAADHVKYGSEADDEEGPGVWAVDNVIVDSAKLNWDHTALKLSSLNPGRYKINYYSKREPSKSWCGYIQVIEDVPPISSAPTCDPGEAGVAPVPTKMRIVSKSGKEYRDGDRIVVKGERDLNDLSELELMSTHVESKGTKRVTLNKSSKTDRRYVHIPNLVWKDGKTPMGAAQGQGTMESSNEVEISYNDDVLTKLKPRIIRTDGEKEANEGVDSLDLKQIIDFHDRKPGVYTIKVTNTLGYQSCKVISYLKSYKKDTDFIEQEQTLTLTIDVQ